MRVEKQGSIANRGFLHLFDWNVKSRKKLLYKTPYLPEQSKQKRSNDTNMPITQFHPVNEDYTANSLSLKGSSVYSCASSQMNEDEYGKSPGVVARLMGLDSMPTSNFSDTLLDSQSMRDSSAPYVRKSPKFERKDCPQMEQKHKVIEKFQTGSLPPKSAKSVPITQNKLLSPIKSSRFVSSDDPACITEAASKIPLVGSSSVSSSARKPSKISGSSRRVGESNAARNLKGQSMNKSWDGCLDSKPLKVLEDGKKSVSLALQAKVNIQKREGLSSRSLYSADSINSQPNKQKNTLKKPSTNSVLKQNNQKQNCVLDRGKSAAKSSVSSIRSQSRKQVPEKNLSKVSRNSTNKTINQRKDSTEDVKNGVRDKNDRNRNVVRSSGSDIVSFTFTSPISRSTDKKNELNGLKSANGGDSLSILLDKKLRDLTAMSSPSGSQESSISFRTRINRIPIFEGKRNQDRVSKDDFCSGFSSNDRHPSLISLTRPFLAESSISSDTANSYIPKELGAFFSKKSTMMDVDDAEQCNKSEPCYVKDILSDVESMFEDFSLGRTRKIVNPRRFDQLEAQRMVLEKQDELKLRRKLVFDCVSECVDSKCRVWARGLAVVRRKDWLAEEVCNKMSGWEQMKDCMVEELVDEDMSGDQRQKWLDYDVEVFEIGVEIERRLLDSLINEVVADILVP
ncbi:uncharacterized protein LOC112519761 [Cynara cardunculus var. scolymus]|uniref:uncharacterized protein LOC112519761 n=1 Tax=Cynara cardunculus var. scolymus TaxID=59895 RepID=UPI000D627DFA|nr:uncharacterized protein LOC112519761 [Cynara cardunculus var. scolymus]